ncbi:MAG UNVERIFIED_CONTAM: hypothetical protein LVR29_11465 [Microcystis novacekii LVE1205-3]
MNRKNTVLQKETRRIVGKLTMIALAICAAVVVIYGLTRGRLVAWLFGRISPGDGNFAQ